MSDDNDYVEKPYKCEFCGKGYNSRAGRHYHQKVCKQNPTNVPDVVPEPEQEEPKITFVSEPEPEPVDRFTVIPDDPVEETLIEQKEDEDIPSFLLYLVIAIAFIITGIILFRDRIFEFFRGKPPATGVPNV